MFDNPKKELEELEKKLLEDEAWFQRELDSAKRMIGQVPAKAQRPTGPRTPQQAKSAPKSAPVSTQEPAKQPNKNKSGKKKSKKRAKSNKGLITLAVLETLGILGLAAYWVLVLLK